MRNVKLALCLAMMTVAAGAQASTLYNPTTDFSISSNPNGVWSYGFYDVTGTTFTPYVLADSAWHGNSSLIAWSQNLYDSNAYSVVGKNTDPSNVQKENPVGSIAVDPLTLFLHPGNSGEKATIRFTAPATGTVDLNATFKATDLQGGNRDVHVYVNGVGVYNDFVIGSKSTAPSATFSASSVPVLGGSTVDFSVGYGTDAVYYNDATALTASINFSPVPEPATVVLFGLGAIGLLWAARRRQAA